MCSTVQEQITTCSQNAIVKIGERTNIRPQKWDIHACEITYLHRGKSAGSSIYIIYIIYSKTCLKRPLKKNTKIGFQYRLTLNAGQEYIVFCNTFDLH